MKTDRYTKFILTVIALALCWLGIKDIDITRRAEAVDGPKASDVKITNTTPIPVIIYAQVHDNRDAYRKLKWLPVEGIGAEFDSGKGFQAARLIVTPKEE